MSRLHSVCQDIKQYIDDTFSKDSEGLKYKSTVEPDKFETSLPDVYLYTMPASDLIDGYPTHSPCIVLTIQERNETVYDLRLNLCVSNASTSDAEMFPPTESNSYDTNSDYDLFVMSLLFTEQVYDMISKYNKYEVSDIRAEYPSAELTDFPYAISAVDFKVLVDPERMNQRQYDDLY